MDTAAARDYPSGDLRVSDAERDKALAELSEAFQAGRITSEEFDERSGQVLRARTGNELRSLLADLPHAKPPAPAGGSADVNLPPSHWAPATRIAVGGAIAVIAVAAVGVLKAFTTPNHVIIGHHSGLVGGAGSGGLAVLLVLLLVFLRVARGRR